MNFLFVSIEDLNDFIEPLGGHPEVVTPNISRLAAKSAVFTQAYATVPACSPARTAALFGKAPWTTGVYDNSHLWPMAFPYGERLSLIGQMRDAGFATHGAGKIFHLPFEGVDEADWDDYHDAGRDALPAISPLVRENLIGAMSDHGPLDADAPLSDERNADAICAKMRRGADGQFWALGLFRPHLPFIAPRRFFELYPERPAAPPGLGGPFDPEDESAVAGLPRETKRFTNPRRFARLLTEHDQYHAFLRAYLASISYADHLLGKVLDRLDGEGLTANTHICLWSDHGWQFGEKLCFRKFTLWERALRIPFLFSGPGVRPQETDEPVSSLDLMPTILSLAGRRPKTGADGQDLTPILSGRAKRGRGHATSVWGVFGKPGVKDKFAFSVRNRTHRYTRYWRGGEELYHNRNDPFEKLNLIPPAGKARLLDRARAARMRRLLPASHAPCVKT